MSQPNDDERMTHIANYVAAKCHRALCDAALEVVTPAADGSVSAMETDAIMSGGVYAVAAFVANSIVVTDAPKDGPTPEEMLAQQLMERFVTAYRLYREAATVKAN